MKRRGKRQREEAERDINKYKQKKEGDVDRVLPSLNSAGI